MILNHYWSFLKHKDLDQFFVWKIKRICSIITTEGCQPVILGNSIRNSIKQDFSIDTNLLPASNVNIGFSTLNVLKKLKATLDETETMNFRKNAKATITKQTFQKCLRRSPLTYSLALNDSNIDSINSITNQICSVSEEMLIKKFDKLLGTFVWASGLKLALWLCCKTI